MDDMLQENESRAAPYQGQKAAAMEEAALALGKLLDEHACGNALVMDMRELGGWTDFFVIGTVSSTTHMSALQRYVGEFAQEHGVEVLRRHRKIHADDEWNLIDLGAIVIHLMTARARSFYELERLWSAAPIMFTV
jgi:ribosome-associated protein